MTLLANPTQSVPTLVACYNLSNYPLIEKYFLQRPPMVREMTNMGEREVQVVLLKIHKSGETSPLWFLRFNLVLSINFIVSLIAICL